MEVLQFIKEHGLHGLTDGLGISIREHPDGLINLDYSQIDSPKLHPVVLECRGLILHKDTLEIACRPMGRFFNYTEQGCTAILDENADYYPKVDGSLIKVYHFNGKWYIATRGTVFADNTTHMSDVTFADLVYRSLRVDNHTHFSALADNYLNKNISYNFEVTSVENRVVTRYEGYTLTYLNSRVTKTGEYVDQSHIAEKFGAKIQTPLKFKTPEEALDYVDNLVDLQEGLVIYNNGIPVGKLKNELYVHVHHSRGDGPITIKRIKNLIYSQDHEEYLGYFPEDTTLFQPYIDAYQNLFVRFADSWNQVKDIVDQKEFAIAVKDLPYKGMLFSKRQDTEQSVSFMLSKLTMNSRHGLLDALKA